MAWSASNMNSYYIYVMGTNVVKPSTDAFSVALFGNSVTPADSTTAAVTQYSGAGSTWSTGNEVTGTGYTAGGKSVTPVSWGPVSGTTPGSSTVVFTSSGTPSWTTASFTAYGGLVYDTTVSNQAISWNYFGGAQTVASGTFTITWSGSGIAAFTA